nr:unnamed protein product [Callosobruchus chinensis]
MYTFKISKQCM